MLQKKFSLLFLSCSLLIFSLKEANSQSIPDSEEDDVFANDPFFREPESLEIEAGPIVKRYRFGVISDLDKSSKQYRFNSRTDKVEPSGIVFAYLKEGDVVLEGGPHLPGGYKITIEWDADKIHRVPYEYKSGLTILGRGMELSTLNTFNGKLYSGDDRTGIIYELPRSESLEIIPVPWVILANGDGEHPADLSEFKIEWSVIKNGDLWVGSHGIPDFNKDGSVKSLNKKFIKIVSPHGEVTHLNWFENYEKMSDALGIHDPGYVTHEAAEWSNLHQKWIFMPRKISEEPFQDEVDEIKGNNTVIIADNKFENIEIKHIGELTPNRGFADCKFIPNTNDELIIAIKSIEVGDFTETYITAFDISTGQVILPETKFADQKYEGIAFLLDN